MVHESNERISQELHAIEVQLERLGQSGTSSSLEDVLVRISQFEQALTRLAETEAPSQVSALHRRLGDALLSAVIPVSPAQLQHALMHYDSALQILDRDQSPSADERDRAQEGKLRVLDTLVEWQSGEERCKTLQIALDYLDAELGYYTPESAPDDWARVQNNRGAMLRRLADTQPRDVRESTIQAAVACHADAAQVCTPISSLSGWITNQNNWGLALRGIAELQVGEARRVTLTAAVACLDTVLESRCEGMPDRDLTMTHNNKGGILLELADLERREARRSVLRAAISRFDGVLGLSREDEMRSSWAAAQSNKGSALAVLARESLGNERLTLLVQAIACYDMAIASNNLPAGPYAPATTYLKKGWALRDLAELQMGRTERERTLGTALACYEVACEVYTREEFPADWAQLMTNRCGVLSDIADLHQGEERLRILHQMCATYDASLEIYTHEEFPTSWAQVQHDKGTTLSDIGELQWGEARRLSLAAAIACYDAALVVYTRDEFPEDWATTQSSKCLVLSALADLQVREERLNTMQTLCEIYEEALTVCTKATAPADWAMIMTNRGIALGALADLQVGEEQLRTRESALACYDATLEVYTRENFPLDWSMAHHNRGAALQDVARLQTGDEQRRTYEAALTCYDAALTVRTREDFPVDWSSSQNNKGTTLYHLAALESGAERKRTLRRALKCFNVALTVRTRADAPFEWAMTQGNKGHALNDLAALQTGEKRRHLQTYALASYDDALSIMSRALMPTEHAEGTRIAGMMLFDQEEWNRAASYLAEALDTMDDLFHLNVTSRGRRNELIDGKDVTANLAYALTRGGSSHALAAVEALERGRARVSGEALARQQAQLALAGRLAPTEVERFRRICDELVAHSLGAAKPEFSAPGESGTRADDYALAKAARAEYDGALAELREVLPDFLSEEDLLSTIVDQLKPDERLAYLAHTTRGSVAILVSGVQGGRHEPCVEAWWDQRLTTAVLRNLLTLQRAGSPGDQTATGGSAIRKNAGRGLGVAVRRAIVMLGAPNGVLAAVAKSCHEQGVRHLVVAPCGLYGFLPVHAALIRDPMQQRSRTVPLQDVVRVSYAPSGRIWAVCRSRATALGPHASSDSADVFDVEAIVVGDPQPQSAARPLPGALDEARVVRSLVTSAPRGRLASGGETLDGEAARYRAVLAVLRTYSQSLSHAHFACHGLVSWQDPERSGLLLANDAWLTVRDVLDSRQMRFERLRLVTLSACQTGMPGEQLPDEVVSLPTAWLQAGAAGVVASLWPVSDAVTVGLMRKFYELHLLEGVDPGLALWLAQRWLRNLPTWREDCLAAGAPRGAAGPTAAILVGDIARTRGENNPLTDPSDAGAQSLAGTGVPSAVQRAGQRWRDTMLLHWAAFAYFGA